MSLNKIKKVSFLSPLSEGIDGDGHKDLQPGEACSQESSRAILWASHGPPVGHLVGREIGSRANTVTKTLSGWSTLKVPLSVYSLAGLHFSL